MFLLSEYFLYKANACVFLKTQLYCFKICLQSLGCNFISLFTLILIKLLAFKVCTPSTDFNHKVIRRYQRDTREKMPASLRKKWGFLIKYKAFFFFSLVSDTHVCT